MPDVMITIASIIVGITLLFTAPRKVAITGMGVGFVIALFLLLVLGVEMSGWQSEDEAFMVPYDPPCRIASGCKSKMELAR